jgi:hypothetical protein
VGSVGQHLDQFLNALGIDGLFVLPRKAHSAGNDVLDLPTVQNMLCQPINVFLGDRITFRSFGYGAEEVLPDSAAA